MTDRGFPGPPALRARHADRELSRPAIRPRDRRGENRLSSMFLDPAEKALYPDWDYITAQLVANFRSSVGSDADDPRCVQLVGQLSLSSERFRYLWGRQDVRPSDGRPTPMLHPQVGDLILSRNKLGINSAKGRFLVIFHAQPGTSSAQKLALLASLASESVEAPLPRR
jgi:MmyB-like transcription regulator ligand binding domain